MKDKLRELADEMEACWICASIGEGEITLETINNWSGRLSAILDAEGDGGAVLFAYGSEDGRVIPKATRDVALRDGGASKSATDIYTIPLYTHPARSGVVSDEDVALLKGIETLCGFVQNGSDTVVKLFQDDATRAWFCKVGNKDYWAPSFRGAIHAAIQGERHER